MNYFPKSVLSLSILLMPYFLSATSEEFFHLAEALESTLGQHTLDHQSLAVSHNIETLALFPIHNQPQSAQENLDLLSSEEFFHSADALESSQTLYQDAIDHQSLEGRYDIETLPLFPIHNPPQSAQEKLDLLSGAALNTSSVGIRDESTNGRGKRKRPSASYSDDEIQLHHSHSKRPELDLSLSLPLYQEGNPQKGKEPVWSESPAREVFRLSAEPHDNDCQQSRTPWEIYHKSETETREGIAQPRMNPQNPTSPMKNSLFPNSNSIRLSLTNHPSHKSSIVSIKESGMRYFSVDNLDSKVWPWIAAMCRNNKESRTVSTQIKMLVDELMKNIPHPSSPHPLHSVRSESSSTGAFGLEINLDDSRLEFWTYLWNVHLKVLQVLDDKPPEVVCAKEQLEFFKWFLRFVLLQQEYQLIQHSTPHKSPSIPIIQEYLYHQLSLALHYTHSNTFYVVNSLFPQGEALVSNKEAFFTKFSVQLVGLYYKNVNLDKWNVIFNQDREFVLELAKLRTEWRQNLFTESQDQAKINRRLRGKVLPWENVCTRKLLSHVPARNDQENNLNFNFSGLVATFEEHYEKPEFSIRQFFNYDSVEREWCAWISKLPLEKKYEKDSLYQTPVLNHNIRYQLIRYLNSSIQKHLGERQCLESSLSDDFNITKKFFMLMKFTWVLNSNFLQILGYEESEKHVLDEQKLVQDYLEFLFQEKSIHKQSLQESSSQTYEGSLKKGWENKFESLIIQYFLLQDNETKFISPNIYHVSKSETKISKEEIYLTEIVLNLLGCYYKNQNIKKWLILFKEDQLFFKAFLRASTMKYFPEMESFQGKKYSSIIFNSMKILPWNSMHEGSRTYSPEVITSAVNFLNYIPRSLIETRLTKVQDNISK